jgi:hypothetical protein
MNTRTCICLAISLCGLQIVETHRVHGAPPLPQTIEFNRDIRPLFSDNCFACHGPDKNQRKAELRLDQEGDLYAPRGDHRLVVPGSPEQSELYRKISHHDDGKRMPPEKFGKKLTDRQIGLLRKWIEQGGKWQPHWSRITPKRPELPRVENTSWVRDEIDLFILARLEQENLQPAPEADRRTLIRRLCFDLTGLPPRPEEVDAFVADGSSDAYEKAVDRLLSSPQFGERMAMYWLDLVRYADTAGYHSDNHRDVAPYRDYVIGAFNGNLPFDRFAREQLAGDLLPNPSVDQKIASGYNRLLQTTEEGGAQAREYMAKYSADRVRNVSAVWLGSTLGCCECHDHKFDPFATKEFYSLAAFFADVKEKPVGRQDQSLFPTSEQEARLRALDEEMKPVQQELAKTTPELEAAQLKWEVEVKAGGNKGEPKNIVDILAIEPEKRNEQQKQALAAHYRTAAPLLEPARKKLADLQRQKDAIIKTVRTTLVTESAGPREMRVLARGNWLDDTGAIVQPGVPTAIAPPLEIKDRRPTRLDLANWLVAPENPLTARVFVNRVWKLLLGQGIVTSLEDFGAQGTWPTHPDLLDWLAVEFRESGWDVKHLIRLIVRSSTYRQSSLVREELKHRDPFNALLARQARFRLDAEMVRDNALAISGLLTDRIGGGPAKPYQPAGYWALLNFPQREWQKDAGENLYRRGLYTYWCRTFLHPSLAAFDAPSREECTVERRRSNTPLQALVLLNDPTYVEAARVFAERIVSEGGTDNEGRIAHAFRLALMRKPAPEEVKILDGLLRQHLEKYEKDRPTAQALLSVGDHPARTDLDPVQLAAWTSVARAILNLHETITRN